MGTSIIKKVTNPRILNCESNMIGWYSNISSQAPVL